MAARKDFTLYRGAAANLRVGAITDYAGAVLDVAGWTAVLTVRALASDDDPPVLTKAASIYGTSSLGFLQVALTSADTIALDPGVYAFSVARTNSGFEDVLTIGTVIVKPDITHEV